MITFFILTFIFLYIYQKNYKEIGSVLLLSFTFSLAIYILFVAEHLIGNIDYFISDESAYVKGIAQTKAAYIDRVIWYFINNIVINYDFYGKIFIKLINIPIFLIFVIYLYKIFRIKFLLYLSFFIPYLNAIIIRDFRDILILLLSTLTIYYIFSFKKNIIKILFFSVLLYLTRPFSIIILLILYILVKVDYSWIRRLFLKFKLKIIAIKIFFILLLSLGLIYGIFHKKINRYYNYVMWNINEGAKERIKEAANAQEYMQGDFIQDMIKASLRYCFTPIPTSIAKRIIFRNSFKSTNEIRYGIIDDVFLFVNQVLYYIMLIYIFINILLFFKSFKYMNKQQFLFILYSFSYFPIYTVFMYGGGHQRYKLPFQIAIFILVIFIIHKKNEIRQKNINANKK